MRVLTKVLAKGELSIVMRNIRVGKIKGSQRIYVGGVKGVERELVR